MGFKKRKAISVGFAVQFDRSKPKNNNQKNMFFR